MAYSEKPLVRVGSIPYAAGDTKSIFAYGTADSVAAVAASGYFNSATKRLRKGDLIMVAGALGGTPESATLIVTSATGAATVTTARSAAAGSGLKLAAGQATMDAATKTVATGLASVTSVTAVLDDDPVDGTQFVTATIGDQAGAPAAGSVILKTWKATDGDATLVASTTTGKKVNWIAVGA